MLISALTAGCSAIAECCASTQRMLHDPGLHSIPRPVLYRVALGLHPGDTP